jgi:hypothetical protein
MRKILVILKPIEAVYGNNTRMLDLHQLHFIITSSELLEQILTNKREHNFESPIL